MINDPDLENAVNELDKKYPGAYIDDSLIKYQKNRNFIKKLFTRILFHACFYSGFTALIYFLFIDYRLGVITSMIYGLLYFLLYILIYLKKIKHKEK